MTVEFSLVCLVPFCSYLYFRRVGEGSDELFKKGKSIDLEYRTIVCFIQKICGFRIHLAYSAFTFARPSLVLCAEVRREIFPLFKVPCWISTKSLKNNSPINRYYSFVLLHLLRHRRSLFCSI